MTVRWFFHKANVLALILLMPHLLWGDDVTVVATSDRGAYLRAFKGFQQEFNDRFSSYNLKAETPAFDSKPKVILALGGSAAKFSYPKNIPLVYCMAPSIDLGLKRMGAGALIKIHMMPAASRLVATIQDIQPTIKTLGVLSVSPVFDDSIKELTPVARRAGIEVTAVRLDSPETLPAQLRRLEKTVEALWILPDPLLITPRNFSILREFSYGSRIPLYVPTKGLAVKGGTVSIAPSFEEVGRTAAQVIRRVLEGHDKSREIYPKEPSVYINTKSADRIGLRIPKSVIQSIDGVIR